MDIYVVMYGSQVMGASAKLQGAEKIRADESQRLSRQVTWCPDPEKLARSYYRAMRIVNVDLKDMD